MTLSDLDVHIWLTSPGQTRSANLLKTYETLLNADEQARHQRFRFAQHRHNFLIAHALVRTTLSLYRPVKPVEWQFSFNQYRRPEIANSGYQNDLRFNLSHTDGLIALAVTKGREVGVDVESFERRRINLDVAPRFFAPAETSELFDLPEQQREHRFLQLWTLKESYIKARGMGLAIPLDHFSFHQIDVMPRISFSAQLDDNPSRWQFLIRTVGDTHMLALTTQASPHERLNITLHTF